MAQYIHWQLCGKCGLERANSWYGQKPEGVVESENENESEDTVEFYSPV